MLSQTGYGAYRRTFEILGIPATKWIMNFVVLTSVSSCFVSGHYTASRMLYSLSKRGDAPALFQKTRKNGTPVFAVLASCVVAFAIALMNFFDALKPREILDILMNTTGMIAMLVYLVIAISQLRLRRKMEREGQEIKLKMWFFPWLSYLVIAFIIASLIAMTFIEQYRVLVISTGGAALIVIFIGITLQFKAYRRKLAAQRPLKRSYF